MQDGADVNSLEKLDGVHLGYLKDGAALQVTLQSDEDVGTFSCEVDNLAGHLEFRRTIQLANAGLFDRGSGVAQTLMSIILISLSVVVLLLVVMVVCYRRQKVRRKTVALLGNDIRYKEMTSLSSGRGTI